MNNPSVIQLWPTPIYTNFLDCFDTNLVELISDEEYETMFNETGSYSTNKNLLLEKKYEKIKQEIDKHVDIFCKKIIEVDPQLDFYMTNSWAVKMDKDNFAEAHTHSNSLISGVLYLHSNKDFGKIVFHKHYDNIFQNTLVPNCTNFNNINSLNWGVDPQPGLIILFPSFLRHSVQPSNTDVSRLSVAFNYFMKGSTGNKENYLEI